MLSKLLHLRSLLVLSIVLFLAVAFTSGSEHEPIDIEAYRASLGEKNDREASVAAFDKVYSVLMHPRCMNCHPAGDIPLQGDDSHVHNLNPQRGPDGRGILTMKCITCHASAGVPGENTPPGNPHWHMPPADMKMVFQGKSAHELATLMLNIEQNGHKDLKKLREHANDTLVKAGWHMGGDRSLPPLTYEAFRQEWFNWLDHGAYAPDENEGE